MLQSKTSDERISLQQYIEDAINVSYDSLSEEKKKLIVVNKEYIFSIAGEPKYSVECKKGSIDVVGVAIKFMFKFFVDYSLQPTAAFNYSDAQQALVEGVEFDVTAPEGAKRKLTIHKDLITKTSKVSWWEVNN
jgi:hypothetical protein